MADRGKEKQGVKKVPLHLLTVLSQCTVFKNSEISAPGKGLAVLGSHVQNRSTREREREPWYSSHALLAFKHNHLPTHSITPPLTNLNCHLQSQIPPRSSINPISLPIKHSSTHTHSVTHSLNRYSSHISSSSYIGALSHPKAKSISLFHPMILIINFVDIYLLILTDVAI